MLNKLNTTYIKTIITALGNLARNKLKHRKPYITEVITLLESLTAEYSIKITEKHKAVSMSDQMLYDKVIGK